MASGQIARDEEIVLLPITSARYLSRFTVQIPDFANQNDKMRQLRTLRWSWGPNGRKIIGSC
ncbi:hypothetical protein BN77_2650 [Rhizobium mesoamericanum STM3625]|uniref:Uncharacterized protein n=1 Tax=Rhizobium mesoamericanum STM3625 TaxID=1211777 RepID=K0PVF3_9HYPH|nr:hypothetical protein BN77_2650 [Rhizobium mesoamericanum STM3625]